MPQVGQVNDRALFMDYTDKPLRMVGASWIEQRGSAYLFDDFVGPALAADKWTATDTVAAGAGKVTFIQSASAGQPVAGHGGWLRGTCSDNAGGAEEIGGSAQWRCDRCGNGMLIFETRVALPSVAAVNMAAGFGNTNTFGNNLAFNVSGTTVLVATATNGACWVFDTRMTSALFVGGLVDNSVLQTTNTTTAAQGTAATPAVTTSYVLRVELDSSGNAFFYQGVADVPNSTPAFVTQGRQATSGSTLKTTLVAPYIGIDNAGAGANKSLDVDYILTACARNG